MYNSIIDKFNSYIKYNKIFHAYLIEVNNYEDDLKLIYSFIKMIISNKDYDYVINNNDNIFLQIDNNDYPDVYVLEAENGKVINKNQILLLQKEMSNKSLLNNKRVYLIKECEKLNAYSANSLLKFLEEPNDNIVGILLTNNVYKVIETVISRCQILKCNNSDFDIDDSLEIEEFVDGLLNPKKIILNYDYFYNKFIVDKEKLKKILFYSQIYYMNNLNNELKNKSININNNYIKYVVLIENEISKLNFNVNLKLWFDSFLSRILEDRL